MDTQLIGILVAVVGILIGVPGTLVALKALRRRRESDAATDDEHDSDTAETPHRLTITVDQPGVPRAETEVSYWAGRPDSLCDWFYGREDELDAIASSFAEGRAVVISGGAGSGKSRLATEYGHRKKVNGFWTAAGTDLASTLAGLAPALGGHRFRGEGR